MQINALLSIQITRLEISQILYANALYKIENQRFLL